MLLHDKWYHVTPDREGEATDGENCCFQCH